MPDQFSIDVGSQKMGGIWYYWRRDLAVRLTPVKAQISKDRTSVNYAKEVFDQLQGGCHLSHKPGYEQIQWTCTLVKKKSQGCVWINARGSSPQVGKLEHEHHLW